MNETLAAAVFMTIFGVYLILDSRRLGRLASRAEDRIFRHGESGPGNALGPWFFKAMGYFGLAIIAFLVIIGWREQWF